MLNISDSSCYQPSGPSSTELGSSDQEEDAEQMEPVGKRNNVTFQVRTQAVQCALNHDTT